MSNLGMIVVRMNPNVRIGNCYPDGLSKRKYVIWKSITRLESKD